MPRALTVATDRLDGITAGPTRRRLRSVSVEQEKGVEHRGDRAA